MSYFGNLVTMAMSTIHVNLKKIGETEYPLYSTAFLSKSRFFAILKL
jgi:hypothetical protein